MSSSVPPFRRLWRQAAIALIAAALLAAPVVLSQGADAQALSTSNGAAAMPDQPSEYRIGPLDKLNIDVFEVKDLSFEKVQVDANGQLLLPLIGLVDAKGKTARELSSEIAARLDQNFTQDAQVTVVVDESASQKVTVEGAVTEAGVFQIHGRATLLQAIAMAKGVSKTADLSKVTIFRTANSGLPEQLHFDARAIEKGRQIDPEVVGNDVVIVGESGSKNALAQAASLAPFLYILTLVH